MGEEMHGHHNVHMRKGTNSVVKTKSTIYQGTSWDLGSKLIILKQSLPAI